MRLATRNVSGRPLLSAVAGAKSREGPGQERHKAALKREHGSDEPFGANSRRSEWPARSARRGAKSELAQVRAHDDFEHSDRTQRASTRFQVRPEHLARISHTTVFRLAIWRRRGWWGRWFAVWRALWLPGSCKTSLGFAITRYAGAAGRAGAVERHSCDVGGECWAQLVSAAAARARWAVAKTAL
jgi:hypothetical protein